MSLWTRGVVVVCLLAIVACSPGPPPVSEAEAEACAELVAGLPDQVAGEDLSDDDDRTAAWGGIELTCGVEQPAAYDEFASCSLVDGVGWFLPPTELTDLGSDITATALTHTPRVSVLVPADLRGTDAVLAEISPAVRTTLTEREPCL